MSFKISDGSVADATANSSKINHPEIAQLLSGPPSRRDNSDNPERISLVLAEKAQQLEQEGLHLKKGQVVDFGTDKVPEDNRPYDPANPRIMWRPPLTLKSDNPAVFDCLDRRNQLQKDGYFITPFTAKETGEANLTFRTCTETPAHTFTNYITHKAKVTVE